VVVLSDLHLGVTTGTATDNAFVSFLQWLTERAHRNAEPWRLVLLGDLLDLLHPPAGAPDPLAALDAVAARHRSALAALGATAARGVSVDLVPGNHDSELVDPSLQERLRALVADAAGTSPELLRPTFRVRPWFLLLPGLLYAEHGSQYHALNAVADPLAPFGHWSRRLPPGAVLELFGRAEHGARAPALPHLAPAAFRALFRHGRKHATTGASLHLCSQESGLSPDALTALRGLADDSPAALLRNAYAAVLGHADHVESRQQQATIAVHQILERERQPVPVYVFGHTHRVAHRTLHADGTQLLWFNAGAWTDGSYGFVEVDGRPDGAVARLRHWNPAARFARTSSEPLLAQPSIGQARTFAAGSPGGMLGRPRERGSDPSSRQPKWG